MSLVLSLSQGSLEVLLNGGSFENPVVQILEHNVTQDNDGYERFQLLVSDGMHSHNFHMLKTPENAKLMQDLSKYSVVRIQKFISLLKRTNTSEKFVKVIFNMEMVMDGKNICKELGNPQIWREKSDDISQDSCKPMVVPSSDNQLNTSIAQPSPSNFQHTALTAEPTTPAAQLIAPKSEPTILSSQPTTPVSQSSVFSSKSTAPSPHMTTPSVITTASSHFPTPTSHITTPTSHTSTLFDTPISTSKPTTPLPQSNSSTPSTISSSQSTAHSSKTNSSACRVLFDKEDSDVTRTSINKIADLQNYNNRNSWQIKACVRNKSTILKTRTNNNWFSMELFDDSGEIRVIAFGNVCDKFHSMFQNNKVYLISGGMLKQERQQYRTNNTWQIMLQINTKVQECMEDDFVPSTTHDNFIPIREIYSRPDNCFIDVIGVCKSATDVQDKVIKDKLVKIRRITLVDNSSDDDIHNQILLTLWDKEAEDYDATGHPVIVVKGARVTQFQGMKELTYSQGRTSLHMNPDIPEARLLRRWYDDIANKELNNNDSIKWITFSEAEARRRLGLGNEFSVLGVVTCPNSENVVYKTCPENWCNKKLVVLENGLFKCEKCNKECTNYKYSMRLSAVVSDPTGNQTITAFDSCAEIMLGKNAAEINSLFEHDKIKYTQTFEELKFKSFIFKICTKMETFENISRLKYVAIHVQPFEYKEITRRLISDIKSITEKAI